MKKYEEALVEFYRKNPCGEAVSIFMFANQHFWYDEGYIIYYSAFKTLTNKGFMTRTRRREIMYKLTERGTARAVELISAQEGNSDE